MIRGLLLAFLIWPSSPSHDLLSAVTASGQGVCVQFLDNLSLNHQAQHFFGPPAVGFGVGLVSVYRLKLS